jgi:hypothetical protein
MTGSSENRSSGSGDERREFFRVDARLPIRVVSLGPRDSDRLALEIKSPKQPEMNPSDPVLADRLDRMERKLDRVLAALDENVLSPLWEGDAQSVSISGAGVGVEVEDSLASASEVLVEILLPETPSRHVRAIARPVELGVADCPETAFAFEVIAEQDRDAIVRFSQEIQRLSLRDRAKGRLAS